MIDDKVQMKQNQINQMALINLSSETKLNFQIFYSFNELQFLADLSPLINQNNKIEMNTTQ